MSNYAERLLYVVGRSFATFGCSCTPRLTYTPIGPAIHVYHVEVVYHPGYPKNVGEGGRLLFKFLLVAR